MLASVSREELNVTAWQNAKRNVALCPEKESVVVPEAGLPHVLAFVTRQSARVLHNLLQFEEALGSDPACDDKRLFPPLLGKILWKKWKKQARPFPRPRNSRVFFRPGKKQPPHEQAISTA